MNTKEITTLAMIAVLYIVLSLAVPALSFGPLQFRIGEMLVVLPFLNKRYTISLTLGCLIVNLFSPLGPVDVFFGTTSTLLMCLIISRLNNKWLIPVVAGVLTGTMIGFELHVIYQLPLLETMLVVGAGEVVTVAAGVLIFIFIKKNNLHVYNILRNE